MDSQEGSDVNNVSAALIELLKKVLLLKGYIEGTKQQSLSSLLLKYSKCNFVTAYERHKMIAFSDLQMVSHVTQISPKLVCEPCVDDAQYKH